MSYDAGLAKAEAEVERLLLEVARLQALIATMMLSLPWGALRGALLEDADVKAALRSRGKEESDG